MDRLDELQAIVDRVERESGIRADAILGRCRVPAACRARRRLVVALREAEGSWSLQEIGDLLSGRDHTTVLYYLRTAQREDRRLGRRLPLRSGGRDSTISSGKSAQGTPIRKAQ